MWETAVKLIILPIVGLITFIILLFKDVGKAFEFLAITLILFGVLSLYRKLYFKNLLKTIHDKELASERAFLKNEVLPELKNVSRVVFGDTEQLTDFVINKLEQKRGKKTKNEAEIKKWIVSLCAHINFIKGQSDSLNEAVEMIEKFNVYGALAGVEIHDIRDKVKDAKRSISNNEARNRSWIDQLVGVLTTLLDGEGSGKGMKFEANFIDREVLLKALPDLKAVSGNYDFYMGIQPSNPDFEDMSDEELYEKHVKGRIYEPILNLPHTITIPEKTRFEHTWCIGAQGAGKTQLIQYLISEDLPKVERGEASIMVMDSAGDLIKEISSLKVFAPGQPLEGKLIIIKPDVENPPALNLFDMGKDRLADYNTTDRERFTNTVIDQLTYVIDAMMGESATLTSKQETLFRYIIRLIVTIPEATLDTFGEFLTMAKPQDLAPYRKYINKLAKPAQDFFNEQFLGNEFKSTKEQVKWRLSRLRENTIFDRMFSSPKSKLDLFTELNESKVVLIHTDIENLKEEGTGVMGRYFIGALLAASQERASLSQAKRLPVFTYIDECADYLSNDTKISRLLDQARKMKIGLFLAHQRGAQIKDRNVLDALANTAIKFASTDNPNDLPLVSKAMRVDPDFIATQPELSFAVSARKVVKPFSFKVPFLTLEKMPKMDAEEKRVVYSRMRRKYYSKYTEEPQTEVHIQSDTEGDSDNPAI